MTQQRKIAAIINPHSAGGKTGREWASIAAQLEHRLGPVAALFTDSPGAAVAMARQLVSEGFEFLIAVGGDGTANEITNGLFQNDANPAPQVCLGLIPMGTGGDFRRSLGIAANVDEAVEVLASGAPVPIDVGKVTYRDLEGREASRYFVNLVSFGLGGEVAARAQNALRFLGGRAAFFWATLVSFLKYGGRGVTLRINGASSSHMITNVAVGNGRFHGGGMRPCPAAILNDNVLEVTVIDRLGAFELLRDIHYLYSENLYRHPKTHHLRAHALSAESEQVVKIEIDGEALGTLPVQIQLLADRLKVMLPAESHKAAVLRTPAPADKP